MPNQQIQWVLAHEKTTGKNYGKSLPFYENKKQLNPIKNYISKKTKKILDLGCGSGILGMYIKDNFKDKKITFLDVNPKQLEGIPEEYGEKVESDLLVYSTSDKFDLIVSRLVNHYFEKKDQVKIIKKVYSLLNKNGCYINLIPLAKDSSDQKDINKFFFMLEDKITNGKFIKRHIMNINEIKKLYSCSGFCILSLRKLSLGLNSSIFDFKKKFNLSNEHINDLEEYLKTLSKKSKEHFGLKIVDNKIVMQYPLFLVVAKKKF